MTHYRSDDDEDSSTILDRFWAVTHPHRSNLKERYRKDAPKNLALVTVHYGVLQVLCHIGQDLDWFDEVGSDERRECLGGDESDLPNGVYIWEGVASYTGGGYSYFGDYDDVDIDLNGEFRLATKEEWSAWVGGEYPWDPNLWYAREIDGPEEPAQPPDTMAVDVSFSGLLQDQLKD